MQVRIITMMTFMVRSRSEMGFCVMVVVGLFLGDFLLSLRLTGSATLFLNGRKGCKPDLGVCTYTMWVTIGICLEELSGIWMAMCTITREEKWIFV